MAFGTDDQRRRTDRRSRYVVTAAGFILVLLGLAAVSAGRTWGLESAWEKLPIVRDQKWLR